MKALALSLLFVLLSFGQVTNASESIEATIDNNLQILDLVTGIHTTYSQASGLDAKVVEILAGDGMNATRMILVLNTGYQDTKIFELGVMMSSVSRIVFLNTDIVVINYVQDDFDNMEDMNTVQKNRSITIQVLRNADGTLSNQIKILN